MALSLAGCATVPPMGEKAVMIDPASLASAQAIPSQNADWPTSDWWSAYGDAQLNDLIAQGLAHSPDIATAAARIASAEALANQTGAILRPSINADASASGTQQSGNMGIPAAFVPKGINDLGRISAGFSFDLDLWGKNRAALAAATSAAQAASVDGAQVRLMLTTGIASAYGELFQYYQQRDVALAALKIRQDTLALTQERVRVGVDAKGSLAQAQSRVPAAKADIAALDEAIVLTEHRIAALIGAGPDNGLSIARPALVAQENALPDSIGIDLIGRRPDIVAARLRATAAESRIKVAHAGFYPNINLTALVGLQSLGLGNLFQSDSTYGNAGPAISLPIFDGGRLAAQYADARANYDGAVADYNSKLINALRDVADAYASSNATTTRLALLREALSAASQASHIAMLRYKGGLSSQLPMLAAQDTEIATRRAVADLQSRQILLRIALIRSLGGGYSDAPMTTGKK